MANDNTPEPAPGNPPTDAGGYHELSANGPPAADPDRERFRLRAQCAKLRHWCRDLLTAEGTEGVLTPEVERELLATEPAISIDEVFAALRVISQHEPLPAGAEKLTDDVTALAAERERLSQCFFKLLDAVFPDEPPLTDEHFRELAEQPPGPSISEIIDQLEREFGEKR